MQTPIRTETSLTFEQASTLVHQYGPELRKIDGVWDVGAGITSEGEGAIYLYTETSEYNGPEKIEGCKVLLIKQSKPEALKDAVIHQSQSGRPE